MTVSAALGTSLSAFACGNEPNQYGGKDIRRRPYTET